MSNNTMLIFIPNIQSKEDLVSRFDEIVNDIISIKEDTKEIFPNNMKGGDSYEYDCFPGEISSMQELAKYAKTDTIIESLRARKFSDFKITYHAVSDDEDDYCGGEPEKQDYVNITAKSDNGFFIIDLDFYLDDESITYEVNRTDVESCLTEFDIQVSELDRSLHTLLFKLSYL